MLAEHPEPAAQTILRIDLTGITSIDDAGKACLAAMRCQGAELVAADCLTRDVVDEITRSSLSGNGELTTTT